MADYLPSQATKQADVGDFAGARHLFRQWLAEAGDEAMSDHRVFFNCAVCSYQLEDYEQALADIDMAIQLREQWSKAFYMKGKILSEMKQFTAAEDSFLTSLKLDNFENTDTEARIRKNIFCALLHEGFDATAAGHASAKQGTYADARNYLLSGSYIMSLDMIRTEKAANMERLCRRIGRILPPVWFKGPRCLPSHSF